MSGNDITLEMIADMAVNIVELAEAHEWKAVFDIIDDVELRQVLNVRPDFIHYGVLHHAALQGRTDECLRLVEQYGADPSMMTESGMKAAEIAEGSGFADLAKMLNGLESSCRRSDEVCLCINLISGESLVREAKLPASSAVRVLRELANSSLHASNALNTDAHGHVSALISAEGMALDDSLPLDAAGLRSGSIVTAVVTADELLAIEEHFYNLIMDRNGCEGDRKVLMDKGFTFPSLKQYMQQPEKLPYLNNGWYALPTMYAGFDTLFKNAEPGHCELLCISSILCTDGNWYVDAKHMITMHGAEPLEDAIAA